MLDSSDRQWFLTPGKEPCQVPMSQMPVILHGRVRHTAPGRVLHPQVSADSTWNSAGHGLFDCSGNWAALVSTLLKSTHTITFKGPRDATSGCSLPSIDFAVRVMAPAT